MLGPSNDIHYDRKDGNDQVCTLMPILVIMKCSILDIHLAYILLYKYP